MKYHRINIRSWNILLVLVCAIILVGCNGDDPKGDKAEEENTKEVNKGNQFTWWIVKDDSKGTYYEDYSDNIAVQWLNNQYWDSESLGLGSKENGKKMLIDYMVPIIGGESDNFNTMIATGEYPEIIDLSYSGQSERQLYEDEVLMEITDLVEKYLPNYLALLDENPEIKPFVSTRDEEGNDHYYSLYSISDNKIYPWSGYMYRRDWVVKYAKPSSHVWDWESEYVLDNGHPMITPLKRAIAEDELTGWKVNEVTQFEKSEGENPEDDYTDNVVFPSGKSSPYTISDWEWMLEAFAKAIETEGFSDNINAYPTTVFYLGYMQTGDLVSSFGGGPMWYRDENGDATFGGTSDEFKTYLACINNWKEQGWLDKNFYTRGTDPFYEINSTGVGQGMVGLFVGGQGMLGTTIRATAENPEAKADAMVTAASLPINDIYGSDDQKFVEPRVFYQQGILGTPVGFTTLCEDKDMETLFSMINWMYSKEGGLTVTVGLSEEQYASMEFSPDLYAELGINGAYTVETNNEGIIEYTSNVPTSEDVYLAIKAFRMATNQAIIGNEDKGYTVDQGTSNLVDEAMDIWTQYSNDGYILDYNSLFSDKESSDYAKINTYINDYMGQAVPDMILNGLDGWDTYVGKLNKYNPDSITDMYQIIIDKY